MSNDERAAFEAWATDNGEYPKAVERDSAGNYRLLKVHTDWIAWQAGRAALAAAPVTCQTFGAGVPVPCGECNMTLVGIQELAELRAMAERMEGVEPVAWRIFDGEGGYDFRDELPSEESREWSARYGRKWEPLYTAPIAPASVKPVARPACVDGRCPDQRECDVARACLHHTAPIAPAIPALTCRDMALRCPSWNDIDGAARWAYALAAERAGVEIKEEGK